MWPILKAVESSCAPIYLVVSESCGKARLLPRPGRISTNKQLVQFILWKFRDEKSDPHRHDYVAIAERLIAFGADLSGGLLVLQLEAHGAIGNRGEKIQQILRVESDGDWIALVRLFDRFRGFAIFGALRGKLHAFRGNGKLHRARALVGE